MRRHSVSFGSAVVIATAAFAGWAAPAGAAPVSSVACGATIVTSVTLKHDLVGCPGDGLVVGAAGIAIDLNGHTISGTNAPGGEGIADDGFDHLVVEHGTIRGFFVNGVGLRHAPRSLVRNLTIRAIGAGGVEGEFSAGVLLDGSPVTRITGSSISNDVVAWESDGVVVKRSAATRVDNNRLNRNSWDGVFLLASPYSQVDHNVARANSNNGMEINASCDFTRVTDNEASRNGNVGVVTGSIKGAVIDGNIAKWNGSVVDADDAGLFFFDLHDSEIAHNTAAHNVVGIDLFGGLHGSTGNRVFDNVANENSNIGLLIDSGEGGTPTNGANHNLVRGNTANRNRGSLADLGAGIGVFGQGNLLLHNRADGNTATGVIVLGPDNALVTSSANGNGAHGINAIPGTIDGGGNHAHGNLPPQCVGVTCH